MFEVDSVFLGLVFFGISAFVLYFVVRAAVRDGMRDARRLEAETSTPAVPGDE